MVGGHSAQGGILKDFQLQMDLDKDTSTILVGKKYPQTNKMLLTIYSSTGISREWKEEKQYWLLE